jgi:hypothetical protein
MQKEFELFEQGGQSLLPRLLGSAGAGANAKGATRTQRLGGAAAPDYGREAGLG